MLGILVKEAQESGLALGVGARRQTGVEAIVVVIADRPEETEAGEAGLESGVKLERRQAEEGWTYDSAGLGFPGVEGSFDVQACAIENHSTAQMVAACSVPWG